MKWILRMFAICAIALLGFVPFVYALGPCYGIECIASNAISGDRREIPASTCFNFGRARFSERAMTSPIVAIHRHFLGLMYVLYSTEYLTLEESSGRIAVVSSWDIQDWIWPGIGCGGVYRLNNGKLLYEDEKQK